MTRPVEITQPSDFVSCDSNGKATVVFNVTDITGQEAKLGVKVIADAPALQEWFTLQTDSIWKLGANATDQITVDIKVPDAVPPGKYNFRLMVYSVAMPGEVFTKGGTVACEIKEKTVAPPPRPFPWWIVAVAVVVLALGGWGVWALIHKEKVMVPLPNVISKNSLVAQQVLAKSGLQLDLENSSVEETTVDSRVGSVVKQHPNPAEVKEVEQGSLVSLVVAVKKPGRVVAPDWLRIEKLKMFTPTQAIQPQAVPKNEPAPVKPRIMIPLTDIRTREVEK